MSCRTVCLLLASLQWADQASADRFVIRAGEKANVVRFESRAPLETFEGKTNQVSGFISLNLENLSDSVEVFVSVDLASLDTGIELRNKHMRKNHLETKKFPKAVFRGATLLKLHHEKLEPGKRLTFTVQGKIDLHGVERMIVLPVEVSYADDGGKRFLHVVSHFEVKLGDYGIKRPKFLFLRLDEVQRLTLDVRAFAAGP